jgi:hypothetical protein
MMIIDPPVTPYSPAAELAVWIKELESLLETLVTRAIGSWWNLSMTERGTGYGASNRNKNGRHTRNANSMR